MATRPSGEQLEIRTGPQRAHVVEVGGGVREYSVGDRPVLDPYPIDAMCGGAHGVPLIPWPNRLADGAYRLDGTDYGAALTGPGKHNAIHGFLRWRPWQALEHEASRVVMGTRLHPLPGYPFPVDVRVAYELGDSGVTVATTAANRGNQACSCGAGQRPYLPPGGGRIDDCTLELGAATRIRTDNERQLPVATAPVEQTNFDFRAGQRLDTPFTDLARDDQGRAWGRLAAADGSRAKLWGHAEPLRAAVSGWEPGR